MTQSSSSPGMRPFLLIWFGQLVSLIGSGLTSFALGVWTYQRTGSVTRFALITFFGALPGIVLAPLAGALVDRWDKRKTMMLADTGSALSTLCIALLLWADRLDTWHIYAAVAFASTCSALQIPAWSAAIALLVPKDKLDRANGLVELALSVVPIVSPLLAGVLVVTIHLHGVILIDFATFLFSMLTLAMARVARLAASEPEPGASLWSDALYGWKYVVARPGLLGLLFFFAAINFSFSFSEVLLPPLVLKRASPTLLGTVLAAGGAGLVVSSLVVSTGFRLRRRIWGVLGGGALLGMSQMLIGLATAWPLLLAGTFLQMFWVPLINAWSRTLWQLKVAPEVQGRVFAIRMAIAWSTTPIAFLCAGPLADHVFEPLLLDGGPLAPSLGHVLGTGPGHGMGLLFVVLGLVPLVAAVAGLLNRRVRRVEQDLPDALEAAPAAPPQPA
jgi:DHA3 family macrolide efflux protein-like MFS transporter